MNVFATDSGENFKASRWGINVIYFLMEKELTVSIDAMKLSLGE